MNTKETITIKNAKKRRTQKPNCRKSEAGSAVTLITRIT